MSNKHLRADTTGTSQRGADITGTAIGGGKFALDVNPVSASGTTTAFDSLIRTVMMGSLPDPNFNSVSAEQIDSDNYRYTFSCNGSPQFFIDITNATTIPVATIVFTEYLQLEGGDNLLTEAGDNLIQE